MIIYSKPAHYLAQKNLFYQQQKQKRGGKFMFNYKFDDIFTEKTVELVEEKVVKDQPLEPIVDLDPSKSDIICGKKSLE